MLAPYPAPAGVSAALWRELWAAASNDFKAGLVGLVRSNQSLEAKPAVSLSGEFGGLAFDFRRNLVSQHSLSLLRKFGLERGVGLFWQRMATGQVVNRTESRPATHTWWRDPNHLPSLIEPFNSLLKSLGATQTAPSPRFSRVLNVGIGGSEFGPNLLAGAMGASVEKEPRHICLSSLSPVSLREILQSSDLMKTAVVISSKSFTTQESLRLAEVVRRNFQSAGIDWSSNFFAVTANVEAAIKWGIHPDHILDMTHTVGGRYSVASPIGFSFALAYGLGAFESFRSGMRQVDEAVAKDPLESAPFAHALIWFWYRVFFNLQAVAVIPYVPAWRPLAGYLQQLLMESLGKSFDSEGQPLTIPAGSVVLGEVGTNSQHSFMQFLQCSTTAIPVDFLASLNFTEGENFADFQLANAFAQSQALLFGTGEGASETTAPGGRPSNLLLTVDDSLHSLGQIVSFYEHSTVFQAGLYGINPFDQWGVEEGKKIARELLGRVPTSTLQVALEFFGDGVSGRFRS